MSDSCKLYLQGFQFFLGSCYICINLCRLSYLYTYIHVEIKYERSYMFLHYTLVNSFFYTCRIVLSNRCNKSTFLYMDILLKKYEKNSKDELCTAYIVYTYYLFLLNCNFGQFKFFGCKRKIMRGI